MTRSSLSAAYDAIARDYDWQIEDDAWMRQLLWRRYVEVFRSGHRVLDLGCGTGTDAVFLARQGVKVTAIDISSAMVEEARSKAARAGLSDMVQVSVRAIGELETFPDGTFDGIISAFAALNTVPSLTQFAAEAARILVPHGRMILHLLNRSSLWEWGSLGSRGRWAEALQLRRRRDRTFFLGGQPVHHYLPRADQAFEQDFSAYFRLCELRGLGIACPPHPIPHVPAAVLTTLGRLDALIGRRQPFVHWGRFSLLELERAGGSDTLRP
jgi:ubiquinone/menaquinone biosynthesis C-methylase UbiE